MTTEQLSTFARLPYPTFTIDTLIATSTRLSKQQLHSTSSLQITIARKNLEA